MKSEYRSYLEENAEALAPLAAMVMDLKEGARVLCLGPFGLIPSVVIKDMRRDADVEVLSLDEEANKDFRENTDPEGLIKLISSIQGEYDFIFAFLYLNTIKRSDAVPFLFSSFDALAEGGKFYLVFPDALMSNGLEGCECEAFYNKDEIIFQKLYALHDVVHSLSLIGFQILSVEEVALTGFDHASAVLVQKK